MATVQAHYKNDKGERPMKITEKHITGLGITVGVLIGFFGLVYLLTMVLISEPAGHELAMGEDASAVIAEEPAAGVPAEPEATGENAAE